MSENVVYRINKFIASSFAFGCHVGYHGHIFVVGLLSLSTAVQVNPCSKESIYTTYPELEEVVGRYCRLEGFCLAVESIQIALAPLLMRRF